MKVFVIHHICFVYLQGFGGKFGVQSDRMDKSAHKFEEKQDGVGTNYQKTKPDVQGSASMLFWMWKLCWYCFFLFFSITIIFLYLEKKLKWMENCCSCLS